LYQNLEKDISKSTFKSLKESPSKVIMQKASRSYEKLEGNQKEHIKYFLFNEKVFSIDINRCFIAPLNLQYQKVNEEEVEKLVLSLVTNFTTTLKEVILFPFDHETKLPYEPKSEDEVEMKTLHFYILDGKHTISCSKKIY
jgi:hypothetical protein